MSCVDEGHAHMHAHKHRIIYMSIGYVLVHMQKYSHAYTDLDGWLSEFCFLHSALAYTNNSSGARFITTTWTHHAFDIEDKSVHVGGALPRPFLELQSSLLSVVSLMSLLPLLSLSLVA